MDKDEKIFELKLKKIELKLEKEKELHSLAVSILAGVLTFLVTTGFLANAFTNTITSVVKAIIEFNVIVALIMLILLIFGLPFLVGSLAYQGVQMIMKSKEKLYDVRIQEIEKWISELRSKKN
ncbi:MAG TPA: hypothetical protein VJ461_05805 [Candidatus Nanoarchaeia archaeon]|nr:hypothetical protein [Candidatus Nanoarchaeia archaeon]